MLQPESPSDAQLTDDEYAGLVGWAGEGVMRRLFGVVVTVDRQQLRDGSISGAPSVDGARGTAPTTGMEATA